MKKNRIAIPLLAVFVSLSVIVGAKSQFPRQEDLANPISQPVNKLNTQTKGALTLSSGFDQWEYWPTTNGYQGNFYVEVKARDWVNLPNDQVRAPLNLCIVLDRSGSMAGDKIQNAKEAAKFAISKLEKGDRVSVVAYSSGFEEIGSAASPAEFENLKRKIDQVNVGGGTHLSGGMQEGYRMVQKEYRKASINRVLLISDGQANEGIVDVQELARIVRDHNLYEGITISTFGLGLNYNEVLMNQLADAGSGNYYFIENAPQMANIFSNELNGLSRVVARNAELKIKIPEGMKVIKVSGFPFTQSGQTLSVAFRDFSAAETKSVLVHFQVVSPNEVFGIQTELTFEDGPIGEAEKLVMESNDELRMAESMGKAEETISPEVKSQVVMYEANEKLEDAMRAVDAGDYEKARKITAENDEYLQNNAGYIPYNTGIQAQILSNASYQDKIEEGEKLDYTEVQMLQKSSRASNYEVRAKK